MNMLRKAPLALLAPLSLAACAEPPPPATAAQAPPPGVFVAGQVREVSPIDHEMLTIGHAEEEIDRAFPEAAAPAGPRKASKGLPRAGDADKPADKPNVQEEPRSPGPTVPGEPCAVACKALASMASAADRLCKLAGDNDGRCDDARARVRGASARVKSSCPGCTVSTAPAAPSKRTPAPGDEPPRPNAPAPGMPGSSSMPIP